MERSPYNFIGKQFFYGDLWLGLSVEPRVIKQICYKNTDGKFLEYCYVIRAFGADGMKAPGFEDIKTKNLLNVDFSSFGLVGKIPVKIQRHLHEKLQKDIVVLPEEEQIKSVGRLSEFHGVVRYSFYDHSIVWTGKELKIEKDIGANLILMDTPQYENKMAEELLSLWPGVSEILFYSGLMGVLKPFFRDAGIGGFEFLLGVFGPPGHLKTSLLRLFAQYSKRSGLDPGVEEYRITKGRNILKDLRAFGLDNYINVVVDDLRIRMSSEQNKTLNDSIDDLTRISATDLSNATVFLTGEETESICRFSEYDRLLLVMLPQMEDHQLKEIKAKKDRLIAESMTSAALAFAEVLVKNYASVLVDIRTAYEVLTQEIAQTHEAFPNRIHSHGVFLKITEVIFRKYLCESNAVSSHKDELINALEAQYLLQIAEMQRIMSKSQHSSYLPYVLALLSPDCSVLTRFNTVKSGSYDIKKKTHYSADMHAYMYDGANYIITRNNLVYGLSQLIGKSVKWLEIRTELINACLINDSEKSTRPFLNLGRHLFIHASVIEDLII